MKADRKTVLLLFLGWMLVSACQNEPATRREDPLAKGYQQIDRGEYDLAISDLTQLSQKDPRPEVLVTLASAYAARGGVKVADYWGFVIGFKAPLVNSEALPVSEAAKSLQKIARQTKGKLKPEEAEAFGGIMKALALWELYKDRIDAIPTSDGERARDLATATRILERVQTPGGRLYRAILNLILFKSAVVASDGSWDEFEAAVTEALKGDADKLCTFDVSRFTERLQPMSYRLAETLTDLMIAYPEQVLSLKPAADEVERMDLTLNEASSQLRSKKVCR